MEFILRGWGCGESEHKLCPPFETCATVVMWRIIDKGCPNICLKMNPHQAQGK